jgi:hypothetical protein
MEGRQFDELTRMLTRTTSRRQVLGVLAGVIGSAFVLVRGERLAGAACPPGQTDCGGTCVDLKNDPNNCGACGNVCGAGQTCYYSSC